MQQAKKGRRYKMIAEKSDIDVTDATFKGKPFVTNGFIRKPQAMSQAATLQSQADLRSLEPALLIDLYFQNAHL